MSNWEVQHGDCRDVMRSLPPESVDAIVSDPPYGLSFMGKEWDHGVPGVEFWTEALRVAKPGAHLVAFGGTRTYHRLAVAIEDAGWEVRDCLSWLYGSGFPKSLDVSKAIDKTRDDYLSIRQVAEFIRANANGYTPESVNIALGWGSAVAHHFFALSRTNTSCPSWNQWLKLKALLQFGDEMDAEVWRLNGRKGQPGESWAEREVVGRKTAGIANPDEGTRYTIGAGKAVVVDITAPATDAAKEWHGWGTALKPAWEPIILARKPLTGTVAANVTQYGTGAINVDGCRIGMDNDDPRKEWQAKYGGRHYGESGNDVYAPMKSLTSSGSPLGRWPANVLLDEDAAALLGEPSRFFYTAKVSRREREAGLDGMPEKRGASTSNGGVEGRLMTVGAASLKGEPTEPPASRNHHPTVKPIALMRWLCCLVTPSGGLILDPFNGSGSTGCAAVLEDFRYLGCELEAEYVEIARRRIAYWESQRSEPDLFG